MTIICEVDDNSVGFKFRLRDTKTEAKTAWCGYSSYCYLDGFVAATEYYLPESHACKPITPHEFLMFTAVR